MEYSNLRSPQIRQEADFVATSLSCDAFLPNIKLITINLIAFRRQDVCINVTLYMVRGSSQT